jgi:hypothetical protein
MQTIEVIDQVARSLGARVRLTGSASGDRQPAAAVSSPSPVRGSSMLRSASDH